MNKSEYIRLHPELSPKALVALAAQEGITLSNAFVSVVRSKDRQKTKAKPLRSRMTARGPAHTPSAAAFIRQHPDIPAKDLAEMGRAAGYKVYPNYVYMVRSVDKRNALKAQGKTQAQPMLATPVEARVEEPPGLAIVLDSPDRRDTFQMSLRPDEMPTFQLIMTKGTTYVRSLLDDIDSYLDRMSRGYQERHA